MKKEFTPVINRTNFKNELLSIHDFEGFNGEAGRIAGMMIKNLPKKYFYDAFIALCNDKKIQFLCYSEIREEKDVFTVAFWVNGHEMYTMSYINSNKDITKSLSFKLHELLVIQIRNEIFIKDVLSSK